MAQTMFTTWSQEYVEAFFKSNQAGEPQLGRFKQGFEREAFVEVIGGREYVDVRVELLADGVGVRVSGATKDNLLEIVRTAEQYGGSIHFPGALPR
jgi:hypothetical protein